MQICPSCGEENPDRFRMCGMCGTALTVVRAAEETRRTVTVLFCDLKGSTEIGERLDPEAVRGVLARYFDRMREIVESHGGTTEKYIGDAIMAVFGLPRQREEDALRAVRAAHDMRMALDAINDELEDIYGVRLANRTGVNTGEVVTGDYISEERLVTGDAVNVAARLEQAAGTNEVFLGASTYALVRDAVTVEEMEPLPLKGKSEPVAAYRLISIEGEQGVTRRSDTPMVGRDAELGALVDLFDTSAVEWTKGLSVITAPPGVGKSKLSEAFAQQIGDDVLVLRGHCLSYGESITFLPVAEMIRSAAGVRQDDTPERVREAIAALVPSEPTVAARIESILGVTDEVFPLEDSFWAIRRLLEVLAQDRPLLLMFDDIHWAERTLLELLAHLARTSGGSMLILGTARPELFEDHPGVLPEEPDAVVIRLRPLSQDESAQVAGNILGGGSIDPRLLADVIDRAEGTPLFVEQILSLLVDEGRLTLERGVWKVPRGQGDGSEGEAIIPPTISALFSARLDGLPEDERSVIEHASVIGRVFGPATVVATSESLTREDVLGRMASLVEKGLIEPDDEVFAGERSYRFAHVLIRETAYARLLKRVRADLHERFANWLEASTPDRPRELGEICGYHLEQAYRNRLALGPAREEMLALAGRAVAYLGPAARRAVDGGDAPAARNLLGRVLSMMEPGGSAVADTRLLMAETLVELGEFTDADIEFALTIDQASQLGDRGLAVTAEVSRLQMHYANDPAEDRDEVTKLAEDAIAELEPLEYHRGLARAWSLLAYVQGFAGSFAGAEAAGLRVLEHARLAGDRHLELSTRGPLALCAVYGPSPVPEARARCEQLLKDASGDRRAEALLTGALAQLSAMEGKIDEARELCRRSRSINDELGSPLATALVSIDSAGSELIAGDPSAAEEQLRPDIDLLKDLGAWSYVSTLAALLAEALYRQGRMEEADEYASLSEEHAAPDDVDSQVLWRGVRAKLMVLDGAANFDRAITLAEEAVELVSATDELDLQGGALLDLAEVLRVAGQPERSDVALERAMAAFTSKGNIVSAGRAEQLLAAS